MATIKSFTSLEQSRKLAEILPLESADMSFVEKGNAKRTWYDAENKRITTAYEKKYYIPCWSLAALLGVLSLPDLIQDKTDGELFWQCSVYDEDDTLLCETYDNNPVDACVTMIERLNELNLL